MHIFRPYTKHLQSFKKIGMKLWEEVLTKYPLILYEMAKNDKFTIKD